MRKASGIFIILSMFTVAGCTTPWSQTETVDTPEAAVQPATAKTPAPVSTTAAAAPAPETKSAVEKAYDRDHGGGEGGGGSGGGGAGGGGGGGWSGG